MTRQLDDLNTLDLKRQAEAIIPTEWGNFNMIAFATDDKEWMPHLVMIHEACDVSNPVLVRIHSECITGDLFGSKRCDCGQQLSTAMRMCAQQKGAVLYLRQEGRGIGIINKLKAYNLQDVGHNTVDANLHLGLEVDARQFDIAIYMLTQLKINKVQLLTNNPNKIDAFENAAVELLDRIPLVIEPQKENFDYLKTKQEEMGHLFKL